MGTSKPSKRARPRSTKAEVRAKRSAEAAELKELKEADTTYWSAAKKVCTLARIKQLEEQLGHMERKTKRLND